MCLNNLFAEGQVCRARCHARTLQCLSAASRQAYVALSRVRSLDGLQILGHANPSCVRVNQVVRNFYRCIAVGYAIACVLTFVLL